MKTIKNIHIKIGSLLLIFIASCIMYGAMGDNEGYYRNDTDNIVQDVEVYSYLAKESSNKVGGPIGTDEVEKLVWGNAWFTPGSETNGAYWYDLPWARIRYVAYAEDIWEF